METTAIFEVERITVHSLCALYMEAKPNIPEARVGFVTDQDTRDGRASADAKEPAMAAVAIHYVEETAGVCRRCKAMPIEFECDPCGCASWCKGCAMKVKQSSLFPASPFVSTLDASRLTFFLALCAMQRTT